MSAERADRVPSPSIEKEKRGKASLREQAVAYLAEHREKILAQQQDPKLGEAYGQSIVRSKILVCAEHPEACGDAYLKRREAAGRKLNDKKTLEFKQRLVDLSKGRLYAAQEKLVKKLTKQSKRLDIRLELDGMDPVTLAHKQRVDAQLAEATAVLKQTAHIQIEEKTADTILLEEASQEYALQKLDEKIEQGFIDPAALNAQMWLELELPESEKEEKIKTIVDAEELVHAELSEFMKKGFITLEEAETIFIYARKYGKAFQKGFDKKFKPKALLQECYELMRDNARKVAYQTKVDKRTLAGSDHGVRHIYEGNTRFAEQMMESLREGKVNVDFKLRDEVLIRQVIIDHDMGYTTQAALTKDGGGAAKDHPCIGCRYVETNKDYYVQKFGQNGYDIIRDVLLNHSYPSSKYNKKRPEGDFEYNRDLIRSVVSSADSLSTTHETKAMGLFRFPEAIDILQDARVFAEAHGGDIPPNALHAFKQDFYHLIDRLVAEQKISPERGKDYHQAVERKLDLSVIQKTFGQFSGEIRQVGVEKGEKDDLRIVVRMDTSRLQALVASAFGDPVSIAGFKKAMEAFGLNANELKRLGKIVRALRRESDPTRRSLLRQELIFTTDRARFIIGEEESTGFEDEPPGERQAVIQRFEAFHQESAREDLNAIFDRIYATPKERSRHAFIGIEQELDELLELEDVQDRARLAGISTSILKHLNDKKDDALEALQAETQRFLSKKERARLKNKLPSPSQLNIK